MSSARIYGVKYAARCVAPVLSDPDRHRFVTATCSLRDTNEVHVIEFVEDNPSRDIVCEKILSHPEEVWSIIALPAFDGGQATSATANGTDSGQLRLITGSGTANAPADHRCRLWRVQHDELKLEETIDQNTPFTPVRRFLLDPHSTEGPSPMCRLVVLESRAIRVLESDAPAGGCVSGFRSASRVDLEGRVCYGGSMDPHHPMQLTTVDDGGIRGWDLRTIKTTVQRADTHPYGVLDVDYNPNRPYYIVTAGEDATLRFWDLRKLNACFKRIGTVHSHWISRVCYNAYHDQLLITGGTDSLVNLWTVGSVSSAPMRSSSTLSATTPVAKDTGEEGGGELPDGLIRSFEDHEDSIYGLCWSACDAWVFASVSYDGRLAIHQVPSEDKYRILLV
ncbi:unnamed protein product [Vitrella brassicaformis CCMP3155]|uniref:EIPR1-like beta-propeller domain-containing protein n=2 Tax=Vitrella brassicaformis TaxID=1169539 RepID=A0A0G4EHE9_VITBC|nr:unnamed protein product [Vitrella brassicaformis CCMP3155]|mmetsp:Transcript_48382/g.121119  ORF Transcript_48382/g.121119 Transcript_48382/m.121119 type:complete len:393 (+) Transcript_48382:30-1208(+)|eukprot:CEL95604.1 unnamed protein product [Vitrella brassicaformis CCMP3155]